jgi:hypothetical protein
MKKKKILMGLCLHTSICLLSDMVTWKSLLPKAGMDRRSSTSTVYAAGRRRHGAVELDIADGNTSQHGHLEAEKKTVHVSVAAFFATEILFDE